MKRLVLLLLLLMLLVQALAAMLLGTERGSRWLVNIASEYAPGELATTNVSGTWLAGINIGTLHYRLAKIAVQAEQVEIKLDLAALWHGEIRAQRLYASDVKVDQLQTSASPATPYVLPETLALPFTLSIDDGRLTNLSLHHPERETLQLDLLSGTGLSAGERLSFDTLVVRRGASEIQALHGKMKLSQPYPLKAEVRWHSALPGLLDLFGTDRLDGHATLSGSLSNLEIQHQLLSPVSLSSAVDVQPLSEQRNFRSQHHWQDIKLLPAEKQALSLQQGSVELNSENGRLSGRLTSTLHSAPVSNLLINVSAEGTLAQTDMLEISLASGTSKITASGTAHWQPGDAGFNLIISDSVFDPHLIHPGLDGEITLTGNLSGALKGDHWSLLSDSIRLGGELMGNPLQASLNAALSQDLMSLSGDGHYADNHADIDIRINDSIAGRANLALQNLQALHTDAQGAAEIQANLSGTRKAPQVDITVASKNLRWREYLLRDLSIKGEDLGPASSDMMLDISSGALWHGNRVLAGRTSLALNGAYNNHSVDLLVEQDAVRLDASINAGLHSLSQWSGSITDLKLSLPDNPLWRLLQPAPFELSRQKMLLSPLCLADGDGQACLNYTFDHGQITTAFNLSAMPATALSALVGPDIDLSGHIHSQLDAARSIAGVWQGNLNTTVRDAAIHLNLDDRKHSLIFDDVSFSGRIDNNTVSAKADIAIRDHGHASATLTNGLEADAPLTAELYLALTELGWIELFIPHAQQNRGHLDGRLMVSGTRRSPRFTGALQLENAGTDIPLAGLSLNNITAVLSGNGAQLDLRAAANSGPGKIGAEGSIDISSGLPAQLDLAVHGERFLAIDLPEARVLISPNLSLRGSTRLLQLRGNINVPEAALRPQQIPEKAVRVSDDEVIINVTADQTPPIGLDTDIMLGLGSNVRFNGFGLDAKLGGNLQLLSAPARPVALTGELRIEEGRYRAYGQNLEIDRGLLIFQQRIDNPGLDIRAVRRIPSAGVLAGVAITGTLQSPQARLTSEPAMEESEIMAWLLTGRGLSAGSETDNAMIAQALAVYGLEKGSGVTEKIGDKVGLDEISVGSDWETTDASLMLGKQISDRLYLRYAIGLFDALSTVMLRYTVSRRVHLEAQSGGDQQSIDLIYQIER